MAASVASENRRAIKYSNLTEMLADAEHLATVPVTTLGKWTYPQIIEHLAETVRCSLDGYGFKAPWFARFLIAPLVKNSLLTKPMKPGFNLPAKAKVLLPENDIKLEKAMHDLRTVLARFNAERQRFPHPFLGALAEQEWVLLHLRHSEMHMSFVVPASA